MLVHSQTGMNSMVPNINNHAYSKTLPLNPALVCFLLTKRKSALVHTMSTINKNNPHGNFRFNKLRLGSSILNIYSNTLHDFVIFEDKLCSLLSNIKETTTFVISKTQRQKILDKIANCDDVCLFVKDGHIEHEYYECKLVGDQLLLPAMKREIMTMNEK
jgi:hypothetical protein